MRKPGFITNQPRFGTPHKREDPGVKRSSLVTGTIRFIEEPVQRVPNNPALPPQGLSTYYQYVDLLDYYDFENGSTYYDFE